jgi:hypothetical protein
MPLEGSRPAGGRPIVRWKERSREMAVHRSLLFTALLAAAGCASSSPPGVFRESTYAFSEGDIAGGSCHFSERLRSARPIAVLEAYYRVPDHRKGIAFLLKDHRFRMVKEDDGSAVGEVTWTTGKTEQVYFVRENGAWKIDLPPGDDVAPPPRTP